MHSLHIFVKFIKCFCIPSKRRWVIWIFSTIGTSENKFLWGRLLLFCDTYNEAMPSGCEFVKHVQSRFETTGYLRSPVLVPPHVSSVPDSQSLCYPRSQRFRSPVLVLHEVSAFQIVSPCATRGLSVPDRQSLCYTRSQRSR